MMIKKLLLSFAMLVLAGCVTTKTNHRFPPTHADTSGSSTQSQPNRLPPQPDAQGETSIPSAQSPSGQEQPARKPPPHTAGEASSPAVLSLMARADALAKGGRMDMSAATLERALDLEPRNPFIYQQLASVRLAQGQVGQAEAMARKSNSVAGDNPFVRATNWRLIAEARRTDGDDSGAQEATARAANYRSTSSRTAQ